MRKDVKLGLAVGGVLLAVLVVYVLVVPSDDDQITLTEVPVGEQETLTETPPLDPDVAGRDPFVIETPDTSNTGSTDGSTQGRDPQASAAEYDWQKLLDGEQLPSLFAQTRVPAPVEHAVGPTTLPTSDSELQAPVEPLSDDQDVLKGVVELTSGDGQIAPPSTRPVAAQRMHVIQPSETLSSIAAEVYGNASFYPHIEKANPSIDPKRLKPGTTLVLPDLSDVDSNVVSTDIGLGEKPLSGTEYRVQPSDSLYRISLKLYGKGDQVDAIYALNKETIGSDPARVKPGMVLKLPEAPRSEPVQ